jgi:hypothetical protein
MTRKVVWTNLVDVAATGNSLKKTSGCDGCPDAGAVSKQYLKTAYAYMEFTATETTSARYIGLSQPRKSRTTATTMRHAWALQPGGVAEVREQGELRAQMTFTPGDVLRIDRLNGAVRYYQNGMVVYQSSMQSRGPLVIDASLLNLGSTVNNVVLHNDPQ